MSRLLLRIGLWVPLATAVAVFPQGAEAQATAPTKPASASTSPTESQSEPQEETEEDLQTLRAVKETFGKSIAELEQEYAGKLAEAPEAVRMLLTIARGSNTGPEDGWYGPGKWKYSYDWLLTAHAKQKGTYLADDDFRGLPHWLARIDRNHDGQVTPEDLDWSDRNPWVQQASTINRILRRMDPDADGFIAEGEWNSFFRRVAQGQDAVHPDDLIDVLLAGVGSPVRSGPGDVISKNILLRGLIGGEIGSLKEGPNVGDPAPDFELKTHDGRGMIRLADLLGKQPIVLTFGNFTCPPFRLNYSGVEAVYRRFSHEATFLSIYVREAHPNEGWKMAFNTRLGIEVSQPKTYGERVSVANQCHGVLKYSMPLLVDEIDDRVGNAYSGMPARMYVIDPQGKVVYKSGRGPFGFRPGEMEQALVMCLLEQHLAQQRGPAGKPTPASEKRP
jgi:hypothetical protein